ncbi:MAG: GtrA family protein [Patescibacteria group bacterium]
MQSFDEANFVTNEISKGIKFSKTDFWSAIIAGELIALLSLPVWKNLGFFELAVLRDQWPAYLVLALWMIFMPAISVASLYLSYRLAVYKWPILFKIGKYGIIGWLNTFLSAGIFNVLILITGIAEGWLADIFFAIAFAITITQSFFWQKFWTFGAHHINQTKIEYVKFFTVTTATSLLNIFLLHIIINTIGAPQGIDSKIWANMAFVMLIPVAFFGNFFGYKIFVFKT